MKFTVAVIAAVAVPVLAAQAPPLKPGEYEVVSQFAVPGRPSSMPPRKDTRCYTEKELATIERIVAGRDTAQGQCHVVSSKMSGSTLTFTTECASPDGSVGLTMSGDMTFTSREAYHGVVHMKMPPARGGPGANGSTVTIDGKRVGDCAK